MVMVKMLLVFIAAWIGSFWPTAWTPLLLTVAVAILCLQIAHGRQVQKIAGAAAA